ncbi:hypothetical protein GGR57DRAFT_515339 [Xylariaceae sp. FL1272]|nr:hypothetical protein GGR57DRAFT_515339 [Xylariaceae sp. FL1272]
MASCNVNTVDVLYPATPFLYANPHLLRYTLQPIYELHEGRFYPNDYCIHDLCTHFPHAIGHSDGADEYMPVEESANFILMSYAYYKFTGDEAWLASHYMLLKQFTKYLISSSSIPEKQLSTDDFAVELANQINLALNGIIGLQASSSIATLVNNTNDALWGLLYNLYFDKLLNMGLVNDSVYTMQSQWYPVFSQVYGVPLDIRHHYTQSDWETWAAATRQASTRRLLVNNLMYWLNNTFSGAPFADLYECIGSGDQPQDIYFSARPVAGLHYALLALGKTGQTASSEGEKTAGCLFARNSTQAFPVAKHNSSTLPVARSPHTRTKGEISG